MSQDTWKTPRRKFLGGVGAVGASIPMLSREARARLVHGVAPDVDGSVAEDVEVRTDVMVEMRDGTKLATDVYLPADGESHPTLVTRTPYDKTFADSTATFFAQHGYAAVTQDVRGKYNSEGTFYPYRSEGFAEGKDGYDTVEWAADRSWSNGKVGTYGISYLAGTQWAIAHNDELPPHLETMAPGFSASSYYGQGAYSGGAALLSHNVDYLNGFAIELFDRENPERADEFTRLKRAQEAMMQLYWDLPVRPFAPHRDAGVDLPWLDDWHGHETYDDYWRQQDHARHYEKVDVPVLNYGGWYDIFDEGTVNNFRGLRADAATGDARNSTELVMGPYTHGDQGMRAQGQVTGHAFEFAENATYSEHELLLDWFDRHLKGEGGDRHSVRLYVPGLDEWVGGPDFPLPETDFTKYYLHSDGDANVSNIDDENLTYGGRLRTEPPEGAQPCDSYTYDPADPVLTVGGYNTHWNGGVADRATAYHDRDDVLVYETEVLEEDVAVVGPITVTLYASTSAVDTDFVVVLSDVEPTGRAGGIWVAEGARRGRIGDVEADPREPENFSEVELLEPDRVYAWKIAVWPTARVFEAGHRIRIDVASSNFPRYDRNLNTGEGLTGEEMREAEQTVFHSASCPSHVELPIVPTSALEARRIDGAVPNRGGSE